MIADSLRSLPPEEARFVANEALLALLDASDRRLDRLPATGPSVDRLIRELASRAKVDLNALDRSARNKLLELASDAVRSIALGDIKNSEVSDRIGTLGLLKPSDYKLVPTQRLLNDIPNKALKVKTVEDAIRNSDAQQHLFPPKHYIKTSALDFEEDGETPFISLFAKVLNRDAVELEQAFANWCLVIARRKGQRLNMFSAWRIFEDDINLPAGRGTPLDLLGALAEVFGENIHVGPTRTDKLIVYDRVPFSIDAKDLARAVLPHAASIVFEINVRPLASGETDVALAFAINMDKYMFSLRKHGVQVPLRYRP